MLVFNRHLFLLARSKLELSRSTQKSKTVASHWSLRTQKQSPKSGSKIFHASGSSSPTHSQIISAWWLCTLVSLIGTMLSLRLVSTRRPFNGSVSCLLKDLPSISKTGARKKNLRARSRQELWQLQCLALAKIEVTSMKRSKLRD